MGVQNRIDVHLGFACHATTRFWAWTCCVWNGTSPCTSLNWEMSYRLPAAIVATTLVGNFSCILTSPPKPLSASPVFCQHFPIVHCCRTDDAVLVAKVPVDVGTCRSSCWTGAFYGYRCLTILLLFLCAMDPSVGPMVAGIWNAVAWHSTEALIAAYGTQLGLWFSSFLIGSYRTKCIGSTHCTRYIA